MKEEVKERKKKRKERKGKERKKEKGKRKKEKGKRKKEKGKRKKEKGKRKKEKGKRKKEKGKRKKEKGKRKKEKGKRKKEKRKKKKEKIVSRTLVFNPVFSTRVSLPVFSHAQCVMVTSQPFGSRATEVERVSASSACSISSFCLVCSGLHARYTDVLTVFFSIALFLVWMV